MARCAYVYPASHDRCVYAGCEVEGDMCPAHVELLRDRAGTKERRRDAKRAKDKETYAKEGMPAAVKRPPRTRPKFSQPSRVQSAKAVLNKVPTAPAFIDHTAPWRCGQVDCARCAGKPDWPMWRAQVAARLSR